MKRLAGFALFLLTATCGSQTGLQIAPQEISPAQLEAVNGLPLDQAVKQRERFKAPLKAAAAREQGKAEEECSGESGKGQQPYNVCMGQASTRADQDYAVFYNNLQMLCHDEAQLTTMQTAERAWRTYREAAMTAAHAAWPDGTGAPGFAGQVYLQLVRGHLRELETIYGLNIAQ